MDLPDWAVLGTEDWTLVQLKLNTTVRVTLSEEVPSALLKQKNFLLPREPDFFVGYELSYNNGPAITCGREDIEILSFSLTKSTKTQTKERHDRFLATVGGVPMSATPNGEFVAWFHQGLSPGDCIRIKVIETKCSGPSFILQE